MRSATKLFLGRNKGGQTGWRMAIALFLLLVPELLHRAFAQTEATPPQAVMLSLSEVIQAVVRSNRELQNAQLDRRVQRQELQEAESLFNPRLTPAIGIGITAGQGTGGTVLAPTTLPPQSSDRALPRGVTNSTLGGLGRTISLGDQTVWTNEAQVQAQLLTRIGTRLNVTGDPLSDWPLNITITQPLLRGFGKTVNEAPVQTARLTYTKGEQVLRQTLINKVTETILAYRTLYQQQEAVRIQATALANRRSQLQVTLALVKAGRRARADLVDIEQSLADGERQLLNDRNQLLLANSAVLQLMDTPETYLIQVTPASIAALIQAASDRAQTLNPDQLLQTAYQQRPDYLQAKLDIETERLNLITATDRQRWGLDLQSITSVGTNSQTTARLVLAREFGNPATETDVQRRQVGLQKNTNRLSQLTLTIQSELVNQLQTIRALQRQMMAAQQASQLAQQQLAIAQERFKRGKTAIFEVTQKEETLTNALNSELRTKLDFWVALAELDRILGTTLTTWNIAIPVP